MPSRMGRRRERRGLKLPFSHGIWVRHAWCARRCGKANSYPPSGEFSLYLRSLDEGEARPLAGTDKGHYPFWSPDSQWIGFVAGGKLKKIKAAGGPALTICDAPDGKGGSWNSDGVIVFAPESGTPLHRVAAVGDESTPITELNFEASDNSHRLPRFLPNGHHLLYYARSASGDPQSVVRVIGLDEGGSGRDLVNSPASAWFAAGHLFFAREGMLMAQAFDPDALEFTGDAFPIAEDIVVRPLTGAGVFSATDDGTLLYQTGSRDDGDVIQWFDRQGLPLEQGGGAGDDARGAEAALQRPAAVEGLLDRVGAFAAGLRISSEDEKAD